MTTSTWYQVAPADKDALLIALIVDRFGGRADATSDFEKYLKEHNIPYRFNNWVWASVPIVEDRT